MLSLSPAHKFGFLCDSNFRVDALNKYLGTEWKTLR